jgi:hypothetical protein
MPDQIFLERKKTTPQPAVGVHLELLGDLEQGANALLKLVALERSGVYDNLGQNFWVGSDSVLTMAQRLVALAEQRVAELRDGAQR